MKIDKISLDNYITGNYGEEGSDKMNFVDYRIKPMKEDILKLMDKVDSLEQMVYNLNAKTKDQYKLVNDRINEAFDIIKMLERKV